MKNLLMLLVIGLAAYGGYTAWNNQHKAAPSPQVTATKDEEPATSVTLPATPTPAPQPPKVDPPVAMHPEMPAAPVKRLAPEGVFYVVQAFSITTDAGVKGIRTGTGVKLVKDAGGPTLRVTDGQQEFDARRDVLTNDLDVAGQASNQQASQQAAIVEWQQKQQALAVMNDQQKAASTTSSVDTAQRNIALNGLLARQSALNLEAAKTQATITTYAEAPNRTGTVYYANGVRHVRVGDTHVNDLIALRQKLATINSELNTIATRISQVPR